MKKLFIAFFVLAVVIPLIISANRGREENLRKKDNYKENYEYNDDDDDYTNAKNQRNNAKNIKSKNS